MLTRVSSCHPLIPRRQAVMKEARQERVEPGRRHLEVPPPPPRIFVPILSPYCLFKRG